MHTCTHAHMLSNDGDMIHALLSTRVANAVTVGTHRPCHHQESLAYGKHVDGAAIQEAGRGRKRKVPDHVVHTGPPTRRKHTRA